MAQLCLLGDEGTMAGRWEIGAQPLAVGRDETADVQVDDQLLSRRHFVISQEGESFLLKDLDSRNGTWVDGRRALAAAMKLRHHDCIAAGRTLFMFSEELPASTGSKPPAT